MAAQDHRHHALGTTSAFQKKQDVRVRNVTLFFGGLVVIVTIVNLARGTKCVGATGNGTSHIQAATQTQPQGGRMPNFLLAGAQKAGTSAIFRHLIATFPNLVCNLMPIRGIDGSDKEAHYFDLVPVEKQTVADYQSRFAHCNQQQRIVMDATPAYLAYPERIHDLYQKHGTADTVKILIVLREPVSRELSWYSHLVRENRAQPERRQTSTGVKRSVPAYARQIQKPPPQKNGTTTTTTTTTPELMTFEEHMEAHVLRNWLGYTNKFRFSYYAHWLRQWFDLFEKDGRRGQIWVVNYHEMNANQTAFLEKLHKFLDLPNELEEPTSTNRPSSVFSQLRGLFTTTKRAPQKRMKPTNHEHFGQMTWPSCASQESFVKFFEARNEELYTLLHNRSTTIASSGGGGDPEPFSQEPFPRFEFQCKQPETSTSEG